METLRGVGVSNGIAIGQAMLVLDEEMVIVEQKVDASAIPVEIERLLAALESAKTQIRTIKEEVKDKIGEEHALIFDTHVLLLDDRGLRSRTIKFLESQLCNAEWAFTQVLVNLLKEFSALGDAYFMERGNDLKDVGKRVLTILLGERRQEFGFKNLKSDVIIIGSEFGPSNITHFDHERILGFATDFGGQTTHTAIIARALGLPAVVGLHDATKRIKSGDTIILDSFSGKLFVNPDPKTMAKYVKLRRLYEEEEALYLKEVKEPAISLDGVQVELLANIELSSEVEGAIGNGAQGVGLYRTEFLFLQCDPDLPTEQVHFDTYCEIATRLAGRQLTIRTLDLGGEKFFNRTFHREKEVNPVMGLRGIRLCLQRKDVFRTQLRAILRAMHLHPNIRMMFPLICGVAEWRQTRAFLDLIIQELREEGIPFCEKPTVGVMIEVPSAAMVADLLAKEVHFFSIGTNDLIQYLLAIDRANDDVGYLYDPLHPGVVRMLKMIVDAANAAKIPVSCCGEMASSPLYAGLLINLGLRTLSMNPASLPIIHHLVRAIDFRRLDEMAPAMAEGPTGVENLKAYTKALEALLNKRDFNHFIGSSNKDDIENNN